jgi:hypothetical protein
MITLTDNEMKAILETFSGTLEDEAKIFSDARFFPGIQYVQVDGIKTVYQPHWSLNLYEQVLAQIERVDSEKYARIHKGTPFYIMGWLAYEMKDYEKGVFYMDAALSEDIHNFLSKWQTLPAASFIFLEDANQEAAARDITVQMKIEVNAHLDRFSRESGLSLNTTTLIDKFLEPNATDDSYRSIITALLTFLLEGKERQIQLNLRSKHGGSIEPFITHLFKGGLIFESLLKKQYTGTGITLEKYLPALSNELELKKSLYTTERPYKFGDMPGHLQKWEKEDFHEKAIALAYAIRNTSGHDLGWQVVLTEEFYSVLFDGIVNAIFWTIKKVYKI